MSTSQLRYDVNQCGFDRFFFHCSGWCFSIEEPSAPVKLRVETLDDRVRWEGETHEVRPDVVEAYRTSFPSIRKECGFNIRITNFIVAAPVRIRAILSDGSSIVIGSYSEGMKAISSPSLQPNPESLFKERYTTLLKRSEYDSSSSKGNVCFLVSNDSIDSGRGDLFVALGLGLRLSERGFGVLFRCPSQWNECPRDTDVVVGMLPSHVPFLDRTLPGKAGPLKVAWLRNGIDEWLASHSLLRYDAYFCSSQPSQARLRSFFSRPSALLRLAAEHELFTPGPGLSSQSFDAVSSMNYWGNHREVFDVLDGLNPPFGLAIFGKIGGVGLQRPLSRFYRAPLSYFELPKVYNSAKVCLDCYNEVTRPYGNVNSRVFEALACGLPVVSNRPIERDPILDSTHLFYDGRESLLEIARQVCNDSRYREGLGALGRSEIEQRHSWEIRAGEFAEEIVSWLARTGKSPSRRQLAVTAPEAESPVQLGFYPAYLDNPYQHLLSFGLEKHGIVSAPVNNLAEIDDLDVFHLHWTAPITQAVKSEAESRLQVKNVTDLFSRFLARGGILAWTVHNVLPHEMLFLDTELEFRRWMCQNSSVIYVHNEDSFELALASGYAIPREKTVVAQLGSYADYYPNSISRSQARARLAIAEDRIVFLLFGQIRGYKGISALLDLARQCDDPKVVFVVAGDPKGLTAEQRQEIDALGDRIRLFPRRIDDWEVQYFFRAADYAMLLSQTILNSASAVLALDFGVPLIALNRGNLKSLVNKDRGVLLQDLLELPELVKRLASAPYRFDRGSIERWTKATLSWPDVVAPFAAALRTHTRAPCAKSSAATAEDSAVYLSV